MTTSTATHCPRCTAPLAFRLDAREGGGLTYAVSCPPCGDVHFEFSTPSAALSAAA